MSLKSFHVVFITASLGLFGFTTNWAARQFSSGNDHLGAGLASGAGFLAALVYLGWFLKKYRGLR